MCCDLTVAGCVCVLHVTALRYRASVGPVNRPIAVRTVTSSRRHAVVVKVRIKGMQRLAQDDPAHVLPPAFCKAGMRGMGGKRHFEGRAPLPKCSILSDRLPLPLS